MTDALQLWDGGLLLNDDALASHENCCCGGSGPCPGSCPACHDPDCIYRPGPPEFLWIHLEGIRYRTPWCEILYEIESADIGVKTGRPAPGSELRYPLQWVGCCWSSFGLCEPWEWLAVLTYAAGGGFLGNSGPGYYWIVSQMNQIFGYTYLGPPGMTFPIDCGAKRELSMVNPNPTHCDLDDYYGFIQEGPPP